MGRYSAIDYTSGGNNAASGLARGVALANGIMDAYQKGKKLRTESEREALLKEAATAQAVEEVNPSAARMASEYGVAAQNPDVEAAPGARELYVQAAENELKNGKQFRLGDVASPSPLTTEQEADARIGLQQQALAKTGDVEGASRMRADRVGAKNSAQQLALGGIQLDQAKTKQANDEAEKKVRDETGNFLRTRSTTVGEDGAEVKRPLDDDDWIAAARFQSDAYLQAGLTDKAADVRKAMREQQATILKEKTELRARDGAAAIAALKADPANTAVLTDYYKKHFPDGYTGEVVFNPKTGYQIIREDGVKGPAMTRDQVFEAVTALADPKYALGWLDQEAKRAGIRNDTKKADAAVTTANAAVTRAAKDDAKTEKADKKQERIDAALAEYAKADESGNPKEIASARRALLALGVKLDKPEGTKGDVIANPMGGFAVKQIAADGSVSLTPVGMDGKAAPTTRIATPGAVAAAGPKKGDEKIVAAGINRGKPAIFDGTGWVLK